MVQFPSPRGLAPYVFVSWTQGRCSGAVKQRGQVHLPEGGQREAFLHLCKEHPLICAARMCGGVRLGCLLHDAWMHSGGWNAVERGLCFQGEKVAAQAVDLCRTGRCTCIGFSSRMRRPVERLTVRNSWAQRERGTVRGTSILFRAGAGIWGDWLPCFGFLKMWPPFCSRKTP